MNLDADDQIGLTRQRKGKNEEQKNSDGPNQPRPTPQAGCVGRLRGAARPVVWVIATAIARQTARFSRYGVAAWGAHRDSLMTAMNCNYLEKLELGKR